MKTTKVIVKTASKTYPIYFGDNILSSLGRLLKKNIPETKKVFIISDKKLPDSIVKKINKSLKIYNPKIYKVNVSEKLKNFNVANKFIESLLKENLNRSDCLIALGGGVLGDLSAFVASLTKRGIKFINIPTTLLSQVDSSIGGKTAVNSIQGKNLIGTFYQPDFVIIDIHLLNTLPHREMICGYSEILKHSLIKDKKFFMWLFKNGKEIINRSNKKSLELAIKHSCKIKAKVISADEKENNLRMILNFGHTFAHGFEAANKFARKINHGEAVLLGMMMASILSYKKKMLSYKELSLIKQHYINLNLPMSIKKNFKKKDIKLIVNFMKKDKKNFNKKISLILIKRIGKVTKPNSFYFDEKFIKKFLISMYI